MKAKGVVQGDEILQLTEAGVPASKILQEQLGLTAEQVGNIGKQGLSADKAVTALLTGMNQRFGGMMQNQAKTALGLMSTLKDTFENKLMNPWGQGLWSGIKPGLTKVTDWLNKNDKKVTELGSLFKKAGQNVSSFIGGGLEKAQLRLSKLMDSSQWKNADIGGRITLAWDKVIAEPFSSWWNGSGRPKINKVAGDMGSAIGGTIGGGIISFLDALGGKSDKVGGAGNTAGTAFTNAFLQAFDTSKIVDKLISSFKNANLNAVKDPNASNITKAGVMDYMIFGTLGGAALLKGGAKVAKGGFKLGKWAFGKKETKGAASAAEEMAGSAGASGSTSKRASSTSNKASEPFSKEINKFKSNIEDAKKRVINSSEDVNNKQKAYTTARNTFKEARNTKTSPELSKAAGAFRKAADESRAAEQLRKSSQDKLDEAIKNYNNLIKKSQNIGKGKNVSESLLKQINTAQTRADNARKKVRSAGINASTKRENYNKARDTFKSTKDVGNTPDLKKAASDFRSAINESKNAEKLRKTNQDKLNKAMKDYNDLIKKARDIKNVPKEVIPKVTRIGSGLSKVGKFAKGIPLLGTALTLAGTGAAIAMSSDKKKAVTGATGSLIGGAAGAKAGATIGGTIGSMILPGAGTAVGAGVGGIAGGIAGSIGGEKAFDWIYDKTGPAIKHLKSGFGDAKKSIEDKWSNTKSWFGTKVGTPFKNGAINTINFTVGAFSMGKEAAQKAWAPYGQWLSTNVFQPIKNKASETGKWIGDKLGEGKTWASNKWSDFSFWWSSNVSMPVQGAATTVGAWIGQKYSEARQGASNAWTGFSGWWSKNIGEPTKSVATDVGDWIGSKLSAGRKSVESTWSDFSTWFKNHIGGPAYVLLEKVMTKGESVTGLTPSSNGKSTDDSYNNHKISGHTARANGGIVNGPEFSLIGEAGTEAVIPLSSGRRNRGLQLWKQAGKMLGVRMFANGGIVGNAPTNGVAKATANISTSIALGSDALSQFKQYGNRVNTNLSSGILENKKVSTDSVNKVTSESGSILNLFSKTGHIYGIAMNNDIASGIQSTIPNVTSMVKTLTDKVITEFKTGFGIHSPSRVFYKLSQFIPIGAIKGMSSVDIKAFIKNWIGDITSTAGGALGGNLTGWLTSAMAITGTPMSFLPMLQNIAMHESGGDPRSINLWDSNAKAGHPSKGIMQMIDETFSRWALPGMEDIWSPVDNIVSSIRYMIGRYGGIQNVPGIRSQMNGGGYVGYATGTDNAQKGLARINERGWEFVDFSGGENVLTHNKSVGLMERAANSMSRVKNAISSISGINKSDEESKDVPENLSPSYYTSQPQMAMAGASYGDINVDVDNNFSSDTDVEDIVRQATKKFATEFRKALQNIKR